MTGQAVITTDGSCVSGTKGIRGPGGWAAILEDGSNGTVLRGQAMRTTSTQMELIAAIEGLLPFEDGRFVKLVFDCTAILLVHDRWQRAMLPVKDGGRWPADADLWLELAAQFERLHVELDLLTKGNGSTVHKRAHMIAQAQARAMARGEDGATVPVPQNGTAKKRHLVHLPTCTSFGCADGCPFHIREMRRLTRMRTY